MGMFFTNSLASPRDARPQKDISKIDFYMRGEAQDLQKFEPQHPEQSILSELLFPDLREALSILALGDKYVHKALDVFPESTFARIEFLRPLMGLPGLQNHRTVVEKVNGESPVLHQYKTRWMGEARIGSTTQKIILRASTIHYPDSRSQNLSFSEPRPLLSLLSPSDLEYGKGSGIYPALKSHWDIFKFASSSIHDSLQALVSRSCFMAFESVQENPECEILRSVKLSVQAAPFSEPRNERNHEKANSSSPSTNFSSTMDDIGYKKPQRSVVAETRGSFESSRIYIALGSNIGERTTMIETACQTMNQRRINILRTSALYETEPMYVKDQQPFINGVCEVCDLLSLLLDPKRR